MPTTSTPSPAKKKDPPLAFTLVVVAILAVIVALANRTTSTGSTTNTTSWWNAPLPTTTDPPTIPTTTLPVSTGGMSFPDAQVIVTSCVNNPGGMNSSGVSPIAAAGTIKNETGVTSDFLINLDVGRPQAGSPLPDASFSDGNAAAMVSAVPPGATVSWRSTGTITNDQNTTIACAPLSVEATPTN